MTKILATSRNESELRHVWKEWRKQTGPAVRPLYKEYVTLLNEAARSNSNVNFEKVEMALEREHRDGDTFIFQIFQTPPIIGWTATTLLISPIR